MVGGLVGELDEWFLIRPDMLLKLIISREPDWTNLSTCFDELG